MGMRLMFHLLDVFIADVSYSTTSLNCVRQIDLCKADNPSPRFVQDALLRPENRSIPVRAAKVRNSLAQAERFRAVLGRTVLP